jgi:hypothetical protein
MPSTLRIFLAGLGLPVCGAAAGSLVATAGAESLPVADGAGTAAPGLEPPHAASSRVKPIRRFMVLVDSMATRDPTRPVPCQLLATAARIAQR